MIRKVSIYIVMVMMLLSGCSDDSFKGITNDMYGDGAKAIPVVVALGDPGGGLVKGSGAMDTIKEWSDKYIYVYAFARDEAVSYMSVSSSDSLSCLVDGSRDEESSLAGKRARVVADDAIAVWEVNDGPPVYPVGEGVPEAYDFFAYYTDDAVVSCSMSDRDEGSVRLDVEIDGSQDLMSSKAELTDTQLEPFTEKDRIFVREKAFGYYTASRNIVPTFHFRHHLVRLEFELVSGIVREEEKTVYVHSLAVESKYKASFTVAAKDASAMGLVFEDARREHLLTGNGGTPMEECVIATRPSSDVTVENVKMGDCLLLAPDTVYDAYMLMTEKRKDGTTVIEKVRTPLVISYGGLPFESGNQYKVKLTIYGANKVTSSVEMEPWRYGGSIQMDEETDKPII